MTNWDIVRDIGRDGSQGEVGDREGWMTGWVTRKGE